MYVGGKILQFFLLRHAEVLLFVDDHQAEACETHALAEQGMGPDDDIHITGGTFLASLGGLLRIHQPRQLTNAQGETVKARGEGLEVLSAEQGRGRDHGHLLTIHGDDESGT